MATKTRAILALCGVLAVTRVASAVEVHDLKGLEEIFGRYAPAGDCRREPRILVDVTGFSFEGAGTTAKVTNPEYAVSYGGDGYQGASRWLFPFRKGDGYPILMTFNDGEKPGVLTITAQDEGYPGGPPLTAPNAALVKASPYARCK